MFIKIKYEESNDKKENNNVSTVDQSFNKQSENLLLNGKAKTKFNDKLNYLSLIRLQRTIRKFLIFKKGKLTSDNAIYVNAENNNNNSPESQFFARKTNNNMNQKLVEAEVKAGKSVCYIRQKVNWN